MRTDAERLSRVYAASLSANGATPMGVLWPDAGDLAMRFEVLLSPLAINCDQPARHQVRLLDLGCGPGLLLDYLAENRLLDHIDYTGVDLTETMIAHARSRWPGRRFELRDVRDDPFGGEAFDYCIACGAFTARFENSHDETVAMIRETLESIWPSVQFGLGFNVMSKHVDWERDDLFHWPLDEMMSFCKQKLSRHVSLHLNYGLWEASAIVLKAPVLRLGKVPHGWSADAP